jgi:hypothetical protein
METRRNIAINNLRLVKNENNENPQEARKINYGEKSKTKSLQPDKRVPLGSLSNSCYPFQTRNKV